jgi:acetyl-CoA synthetase
MNNLINPDSSFQKSARISSMKQYWYLCHKANNDHEEFWGELANQKIGWFKPFKSVINESKAPFYSWFDGGELNVSYQCIDRHLQTRGDKTAIIWEAESGNSRSYTYNELSDKVNRFANLLRNQFSIKKGDRVVLYMPMIPEALFAMLACTRIGAIHVVVFGGFSAEVLLERVEDTEAKLIITADGAHRHGIPYMLKPIVDNAVTQIKKIQKPKVLVVEHNKEKINYVKDRDYRYSELICDQPNICEPERMKSEDPLFILHTSGSTGKPKGIVHSTAGYILWAQYTTEIVFDLKQDDVFWCTADIGWITGHTYVTYGPLAIGATTVIYEGTPTHPDAGRWWKNIEKHKVTQFYTAPTAIRMLHKEGPTLPPKYNMNSLKVIGTVGEPISPEAWLWYQKTIGGARCPVVDTWWQTETGGHVISPLPGATPTKPGSATLPLPGMSVEILDDNGDKVAQNTKGLLCITKPWPSMLRSVWGDNERYVSTYFSKIDNTKNPIYFTGDGAYYDENGYIVVTGRVDDVINISGHRVGTAEVESVLANHPEIAEVAVVSRLDEIHGESIFAFIVLRKSNIEIDSDEMLIQINNMLAHEIGNIIHVGSTAVVPGLPKTRSGKIIRRILRSLANGQEINQDISTLEDPSVVKEIQKTLDQDSTL